MLVLGLDTATRATAVALLDTASGEAIERRDDPPPGARPGHTTRLLALAHEALAAAGAGWDGLGLIAVGTGPGTFTGLRIGVSSARALAAARELPIVGVSSLRALAWMAAPAATHAGRDVLAVIDARRHEVFVAGWSAASARDPEAPADPEPGALAPEALTRRLGENGRAWLAVGEGALLARGELTGAGACVPDDGSPLHRVSALAHCRLATMLEPSGLEHVVPEYLRVPDAELTRRATGASR